MITGTFTRNHIMAQNKSILGELNDFGFHGPSIPAEQGPCDFDKGRFLALKLNKKFGEFICAKIAVIYGPQHVRYCTRNWTTPL